MHEAKTEVPASEGILSRGKPLPQVLGTSSEELRGCFTLSHMNLWKEVPPAGPWAPHAGLLHLVGATHLSFILLMYSSRECRSSESILGTSKQCVSDFS